MADARERDGAITELQTALATEDEAEKGFHVRQALQLLKLDGEEFDTNGDGQDAD